MSLPRVATTLGFSPRQKPDYPTHRGDDCRRPGNAEHVIARGLACVTRGEHYAVPSGEGKLWLTREWPKLGDVVDQVFKEKWLELHLDTD